MSDGSEWLAQRHVSLFVDPVEDADDLVIWLPEISGHAASILIERSPVDGAIVVHLTDPSTSRPNESEVFWNLDGLQLLPNGIRIYHNGILLARC